MRQLTSCMLRTAAGTRLQHTLEELAHKIISSWLLNHMTQSVSLPQVLLLSFQQFAENTCDKELQTIQVFTHCIFTSIDGSIPFHFNLILNTFVIFQYCKNTNIKTEYTVHVP